MNLTSRLVIISPFVLLWVMISLLNQRQEIADLLASIYVLVSIIFLSLHKNYVFKINPLILLYFSLILISIVSSIHVFFREDYNSYIFLLSSTYPFFLVLTSYVIYSKYRIDLEKFLPIVLLVFFVASYMVYTNSLNFSLITERQARTNWTNLVGSCIPLFFLIKNKKIQLLLLMFALLVVFIGLKRTGILVGISSVLIYFIFNNLSKNTILAYIVNFGRYISILFSILLLNYLDFVLVGFDRLSKLIDDGGAGRVELISLALDGFVQQPFYLKIFGGGYEYFNLISAKSSSTHNDFLDFLLSYGIIGGLVYLFIVLRVSINVQRLWHTEYRQFSLSVLTAFLIYSNSSSAHLYFYFFTFLFISISYMEYLVSHKFSSKSGM